MQIIHTNCYCKFRLTMYDIGEKFITFFTSNETLGMAECFFVIYYCNKYQFPLCFTQITHTIMVDYQKGEIVIHKFGQELLVLDVRHTSDGPRYDVRSPSLAFYTITDDEIKGKKDPDRDISKKHPTTEVFRV